MLMNKCFGITVSALMGTMLVSKNIEVVHAVIFCLFVFIVGTIGLTEANTTDLTPLSLKTDSGNETECDCGPHGKCELDKDGSKICSCTAGFEVNDGLCEECDCGKNGLCRFSQGEKACICKSNYADKDGICTECDCGRYGACVFRESVKTCFCLPQYADNNGTCTECLCLLPAANGIEVIMRCTFENGKEKCKCPKGYKQENTKCLDIDECLDSSACPNNTNCSNSPGDYTCFCKTGYEKIKGDAKRYGCRDMDACEYDGCPHNESTSCVNTQGGFFCQCKPGYSRKYGTKHAIKALGCEKDGLATGYIILITVAALVVVVAVSILVRKQCMRSYRTGH